ncbi:MAG TPA: alkaline phosphatase family protein [Terriglobales bacterium]|nr:alkaline phosphatase family protein [Terriglobales bacterium]
MKERLSQLALTAMMTVALAAPSSLIAADKKPVIQSPRNVIIFVVDGLRAGSVNPTDAPTLYSIRQQGVNFANSHAMFPTFTTPNGATIATGHYPGDTGDFSNTLFSGYPIFNTGNFGKLAQTNTPFVENDQILADLDDHYGGNWLTEESLLALLRQNGYNTASVGKHGPVGIQDVSQLQPVSKNFVIPDTVFIDDATGNGSGIPLKKQISDALIAVGLATAAPSRSNGCGATDQCNNGFSGNNVTPGTTSPNTVQQQYFTDTVTKAILPTFVASGHPFAILFWSRDADGTQHNQGDSLNSLTPGINGSTSKAAVANADKNLKQILDYINANPQLAKNTDIFITADHGFATISRHEVDALGTPTQSYSALFTYKDATGRVEVNPGFLPPGFVAIDIAHALNLPLYDPDSIITDGSGNRTYELVDPTIGQQTSIVRQRPAAGDGLIGASGVILDSTDAKVVVAANGGSDLIYIPDHDATRLLDIVSFLSTRDYVGAIFVDDSYGSIPGTLPLSAIALVGNAQTPRPAIALGFKTFYLDPADLQSAVQIADTSLQEGQGMHGSIARDNTFNNMAAIGPDFKKGAVIRTPISNADIAPTLAYALGMSLPSQGTLKGRVIFEALKGGKRQTTNGYFVSVSEKAVSGKSSVLFYQMADDQIYLDEACFTSARIKRANPVNKNPCR